MVKPVSVSSHDSCHQSEQPAKPNYNLFVKNDDQTQKYGKLLDLDGNEFKIPNYKMKQIYDAIPKDCFERNVFKSLRYLFQDLALIAATFYTFNGYVTPQYIQSYPLRFMIWSCYTFIQGVFGSGVWVLAHECGHSAFSTSQRFDDILGFIIHTTMLVPYFSFKIVHRNHHKHNANMSTDTSRVPLTRLAYAQSYGKTIENIIEYSEDTPIYTFLSLLSQQTVGWPIYMGTMMGVGEYWFEKKAKKEGDQKPKPEINEDGTIVRKHEFRDSQLNPFCPLFEPLDAKLILISDIGLLIMLCVLCTLGQKYGWMNLAVWYGIPYLWINYWLFLVTFLHHHDGSLPRYNPSSWTFARGAAATIDRDWGWVDLYFAHHIMGTHVLHHHVSNIPHYHAQRASEAIKPVMSIHYKSDKSGKSMWNQNINFWKTSKSCSWVEPSKGALGEGKNVLFFRNRIGVGVPPTDIRHSEKTLDKKEVAAEVDTHSYIDSRRVY